MKWFFSELFPTENKNKTESGGLIQYDKKNKISLKQGFIPNGCD